MKSGPVTATVLTSPSDVSLLTYLNVCQTTDMSQGEPGIELDTSLGYLLKAAASTLHSALDAVLRPLGMTITHYSCLELLAQRPGLSNSELARGAFVTRQSMNVLLQALEHQGLVVRPDRKSTRLNSSHMSISYAVFCLKKKKPPHTVFRSSTKKKKKKNKQK